MTDLVMTLTNTGGGCGSACQVVGGAYPLTFTGTSASGAWFGTFDIIFEFPVGVFNPATYSVNLFCNNTLTQFNMYSNPIGFGSPFCSIDNYAGATFTCSPFMVEWIGTGSPPVICGCCIGSITITP